MSLVYKFVETPESWCIEIDVMLVIDWSSKVVHLFAANESVKARHKMTTLFDLISCKRTHLYF